jgi:fatty-acyl-CoA synthase
MSWIDFLYHGADEYPDRLAIVEQRTGERLTYADVLLETKKWASYFYSKGVRPGDRVTLLATNRREHLTMLFACAELGALFVPLNFRLAPSELQEIVERVAPRLSIVDGMPCFDLVTETISLSDVELPLNIFYPKADISLDTALLMLFTSGTTGAPKGVMLHGEMLLANQEQTIKNWGLLPDDRTLVETPFFHTGGYNVLCLPLLKIGGTVVLADGFDIGNVFKTFEQERITVYFGVPTMFALLQESYEFKQCQFESLRFFVSGGAAISVELIKAYQEKNLMFKQGFGLTEVGPNCFLLDEIDALRKIGSIGRPMPHSEVMVMTTKGHLAQVREPGELLIRGPHLCKGYYLQPNRFADSLHDGYFKTGDLVEYDEEGFYYVTGRLKDMYISGGENVYPGEVEQKLRKLEGIDEACVVAIHDQKWGEVGHAFLKTSKNYTVAILRELLTPLLSRYKHPHHLTILEDFPLLPNGKIDRQKIKRRALEEQKRRS